MADEKIPESWAAMSDEELAQDLANQCYEDPDRYWLQQAKGVRQFMNAHKEAAAAAEAEEGKNEYFQFWQSHREKQQGRK